MVVPLPVFVLAEGAAVASCVAAAARLAGFPPAVPAALVRQWEESGLIKISLFFVKDSFSWQTYNEVISLILNVLSLHKEFIWRL